MDVNESDLEHVARLMGQDPADLRAERERMEREREQRARKAADPLARVAHLLGEDVETLRAALDAAPEDADGDAPPEDADADADADAAPDRLENALPGGGFICALAIPLDGDAGADLVYYDPRLYSGGR